jgi:hypothetical protein
MHDREKSDGPVVAVKLANNAQGGAAEAVEGSGPAKGEHDQRNALRTRCRAERAQWAWSCAPSGTNGQGSVVHGAPAPC